MTQIIIDEELFSVSITDEDVNVSITEESLGQIILGEQGPAGIQGIQGLQGIQGVQGAVGIGVPTGGTTGQILKKNTATNYDTVWADVNLSGYVPYTGATADVDLGSRNLTAANMYAGALITVVPASSASGAETIGSGGGYYSDGFVVTIRVYAYKNLGAGKVFASSYTEYTINDPAFYDNCYIDWNWVAASGADGYRILRDYNGGGFVDYQDVVGTGFTDNNDTWVSGSVVTPNSAYAGDIYGNSVNMTSGAITASVSFGSGAITIGSNTGTNSYLAADGSFSFNQHKFYVTPNNAVVVTDEVNTVTSDGGGPSFILGPYGQTNPGRMVISGSYAEFALMDRNATSFSPSTTWRIFPNDNGNLVFWRNGNGNTLNFDPNGKVGWGNFQNIASGSEKFGVDFKNRQLLNTSGNAVITWTSGLTMGQDLTISTKNIITDTTTGTKIGTATGQKIGFWNATPIVQPTTSVAAATFTANSGTSVNDASTFDGYTIKQIVKALRNAGLLA